MTKIAELFLASFIAEAKQQIIVSVIASSYLQMASNLSIQLFLACTQLVGVYLETLSQTPFDCL